MEIDIEWYKIIIESIILSIMIFGAVFLEIWIYRKSEKIKETNTRKRMSDLIVLICEEKSDSSTILANTKITSHFLQMYRMQ